MSASHFLTLDSSCDEALQLAKRRLSLAGLRALQTFDLHAARHALHDCPCPNHGTQDCDCQMVILMVYGETAEPATLILHGNDGRTWFSIADSPSQRADRKLIANIQRSLEVKAGATA
ncbi:MAG: hypothetical protein AB1750_08450 [Chloroflexota bacterium]